MEIRNAFKKVVHFANWEYKEKRPKSVKVLRVKSKSVLSLGVLPELQIRTIGPIVFIIVSDYGDTLRIYFFNRNGERVGVQNYVPTPKFLKKLDKSTIAKYQLPKKERIEIIDDALIARREFNKIHHHISNALGIYHKYPYTVLVKKELPLNLSRKLGCERVRKEFHIPFELINKNYLEFIAVVEWFYSYLTQSILLSEKSINENILHDLALLLTTIFNLQFIDKIKELKLTSYDLSIQDKKFNLTKELELSLSSLPHIKSKKKLLVLLKNYCTMLKLLNRYRISLSLLEVIQLFITSCEIFNVNTDAHVFYTEEKYNKRYYFYFRVFSKAHDLSKELQMERLKFKTFLLSYIFGLNVLTSEERNKTPYTLSEVIENVGKLIKNLEVYEGIRRLDEFASDMISEYILKYLKFNTIDTIENDLLEFTLEIENQSNDVVQDFEFELIWKPKNRIILISQEKRIKSPDLHERLEREYQFIIQSQGSINFTCQISFSNPLFQDEIIRKNIELQKIMLK
ncbi:MAG: hypothetical protein ACFE94_18635 [Candidatus Hodarchaeota archaeon]